MDGSNLAVLTRSHQAIANKKRAKRAQVKEILFDESARLDYLTGFHKRKLQKKEESKKRREEREKQERQELRREHRKALAERAASNAKEVEAAYGATITDEDWSGVGTIAIEAEEQEDEYSDEEQLATVTVVEDFDPSSLIYGPERTAGDSEVTTAELSSRSSETLKAPANKKASSSLSKKASVKANTRAKKVKYQTAAARKADKRKQLARHTEKAGRAGGKQRRSGGGRR